MATEERLERRSGVAIWRQIADGIRRGIAEGTLGTDGRLPPEAVLAERFGVNRHTLRSAISSLVHEGVLRAEQGRGTFVEKRSRLSYPIGTRTRFAAGLEGQARDRRGRLLEATHEAAGVEIADSLALAEGARVIRLETLSEADGRPVSRATSWFDAARFPRIAEDYAATGSVTAALSGHGIPDYFRKTTVVSARHADATDLSDLGLSPGAIVLMAVAVNVDPEGRPVQYSLTRFAADRVELSVTGAV